MGSGLAFALWIRSQVLHCKKRSPPHVPPLRLEFANALYHTARGDRREAIFVDDIDRSTWFEIFGQVCGRFNWRQPFAGYAPAQRVYTQRVNRRYAHVGHVFQGRFKAILVERESYLLELARYVVLNPVCARMVGDVGA